MPCAHCCGAVGSSPHRCPWAPGSSADGPPQRELASRGASDRGGTVAISEPKADLHRYLQVGRDSLLWKLDGLGEYDVRRPLVRTGTNLLGLVKHLAGVEAGYLCVTFDRVLPDPPSWMIDPDEETDDLWATPSESREDIVGLYRRVWEHADATIDELPLDAVGRVPWWPEGHDRVTLHRVLVHVATEVHRHAGHADIVRELIDGTAGLRSEGDNLPPGDDEWWSSHHERLERAAREAGDID